MKAIVPALVAAGALGLGLAIAAAVKSTAGGEKKPPDPDDSADNNEPGDPLEGPDGGIDVGAPAKPIMVGKPSDVNVAPLL
jgi:hypothetical protein